MALTLRQAETESSVAFGLEFSWVGLPGADSQPFTDDLHATFRGRLPSVTLKLLRRN
jgi:hypothetical protein